MTTSKIVTMIQDMGRDLTVSIPQIDSFVDDCIYFLKQQQLITVGANYSNDIFEVESARQDALVSKFSMTVQ